MEWAEGLGGTHYVYEVRAADTNELLYIGCTGNPDQREQGLRRKFSYIKATYQIVAAFANRRDAYDYECIRIKQHQPPENLQSNPDARRTRAATNALLGAVNAAKKPAGPSKSKSLPRALAGLPISARQYVWLRQGGAFGEDLRSPGSGCHIAFTEQQIAAIRTMAAEYVDLIAEFESRYGHIANGSRWAELLAHIEEQAAA